MAGKSPDPHTRGEFAFSNEDRARLGSRFRTAADNVFADLIAVSFYREGEAMIVSTHELD